VWSKSRRFTAEFFFELSEIEPGSEKLCSELNTIYLTLANLLSRIGAEDGEEAIDDRAKIDSLSRAREDEERGAALITRLRTTALAEAIASSLMSGGQCRPVEAWAS